MYIKKAQIDNFGKFHHRTIHFSPGLNVVYGENESGKSTLHGFLVGMLFGVEKQRGRGAGAGDYQRYEPWNTASYFSGSLDFSVGEKDFTIERNFYHRERTARLYCQRDGEELSVEHGDMTMLLGGVRKTFYETTYCIAQAAVANGERFAEELKQELNNRAHGGEYGVDVERAGKLLEQKRKFTEQRQKECRRKKQERMERLTWEQELLKEDIRQLEQKMSAALAGSSEHADSEPETGATGAGQEDSGKKPMGLLWRLPIIGWILRFLRWLFRLGALKDAKAGETDSQEALARMQTRDQAPNRYQWDILTEQLQEKQTRLFNVKEELSEAAGLTPEEREIETELRSIRLALDVLRRVSLDSYQEGRDEIQAAVSEIFSGVTGGKYDRLEVTESGEVFLYAKERRLRPWQLSRGAMEQLYFALRLGTGRCILEEEPMPILLDETFCAYDDLRLGRTLQWLARQEEQVILFTCRKRELELLRELGIEHHRILL